MQNFLADHSNVHLHFTPTYSSWLNQVEIWFSRIEREVISRGIFSSVSDLARKLRRKSPKGGQRSLRQVADELAKVGFVTSTGKPYAATAVARMLDERSR